MEKEIYELINTFDNEIETRLSGIKDMSTKYRSTITNYMKDICELTKSFDKETETRVSEIRDISSKFHYTISNYMKENQILLESKFLRRELVNRGYNKKVDQIKNNRVTNPRHVSYKRNLNSSSDSSSLKPPPKRTCCKNTLEVQNRKLLGNLVEKENLLGFSDFEQISNKVCMKENIQPIERIFAIPKTSCVLSKKRILTKCRDPIVGPHISTVDHNKHAEYRDALGFDNSETENENILSDITDQEDINKEARNENVRKSRVFCKNNPKVHQIDVLSTKTVI